MDGRTLPKVELHCHLVGVIDPPLLTRIRESGGTVLVDPGALRRAYPIWNLAGFNRWLETLKPYQAASFELMRPILAAHAANLIAQNVVYTEIMMSPAMFPHERNARVRAFQEWRDWTFDVEQGKTQVEYIMVLPRTLDAALVERDTRSFLELHREGCIVGVALVGVETGQSIERFAGAFARWRDAGLGIEIHAGEHSDAESVNDALRFGRPHRIGHGLSAFQDRAVVNSIKVANVHLEFCPTSNLRTGAITDISRHPVKQALAEGLSFSVNTDDPGAFECSLEDEQRLLGETFGFGPTEFRAIFRNSLAARFQPELRYLGSDEGEALWP